MLRKDMAWIWHSTCCTMLGFCDWQKSLMASNSRKSSRKSILNHDNWFHFTSCAENLSFFYVNVKSRKFSDKKIIIKMNCWQNIQWWKDKLNPEYFCKLFWFKADLTLNRDSSFGHCTMIALSSSVHFAFIAMLLRSLKENTRQTGNFINHPSVTFHLAIRFLPLQLQPLKPRQSLLRRKWFFFVNSFYSISQDNFFHAHM